MSDTDKPLDPSDEKRLKTRGSGMGKDYTPFICIQDLSSSGESIRIPGHTTGRAHHLLSGIELGAFIIFDWNPQTRDIREQFPIPVSDTLTICQQLGIKHPQLRGKLKVVTTDLLIDFNSGRKMALAVKAVSALSDERTIEKLQIEKTYWEGFGVEWKLFTDREITKPMKENLLWLRPALHDAPEQTVIDREDVKSLLERLSEYAGLTATRICARLDDQYGVEPGSHLQTLRYGIARHLITAPIQTSYHNWKCSELQQTSQAITSVSAYAN